MVDRAWSDEFIDVIETVSAEFPGEARDLFSDDPESLRIYLGSESFFDDLLSEESSVEIKPKHLFFILFEQFKRKLNDDPSFREDVRRTLEENGAENRVSVEFFEDEKLVQYLVKMLKQFVRTDDVYQLPGDDDKEYRYVYEMLEASQDSSDTESFQIFLHIGNYSLFLTGLFPEWIRYRHEYKDRPMDVDSYRKYGITFYERASKHRLAKRRELRSVLSKLSEGYDLVRSSIEIIFNRMLPAFK